MEREAELAIGEAFDDTDHAIRTFNVLIQSLTDEAEHHIDRDVLLRLVLNEAAAQSGQGRSDSRGLPNEPSGRNAMTYAAVNDQVQAAKRVTQLIGRR